MDHIHRGNHSSAITRSGKLERQNALDEGSSFLKKAVDVGMNLKSAGGRFVNTQAVKAKSEIKTMMSTKEFAANDNGKEKAARANAMMVGVGKGIVNFAKGAKSGDTIQAITGILG